ncbi:hypothetical protein [Selenomonas ruminantium]|uniref:hypothetical protein n=1 Tax=Selenomonas ruminantium TaxID=971 RepID=UPI0026F26167|nr:hypothetical protein [Selenomonas ruminantium]
MNEKELMEKFFWTTNAAERQKLLEKNAPEFSSATYEEKISEYEIIIMRYNTARILNIE